MDYYKQVKKEYIRINKFIGKISNIEYYYTYGDSDKWSFTICTGTVCIVLTNLGLIKLIKEINDLCSSPKDILKINDKLYENESSLNSKEFNDFFKEDIVAGHNEYINRGAKNIIGPDFKELVMYDWFISGKDYVRNCILTLAGFYYSAFQKGKDYDRGEIYKDRILCAMLEIIIGDRRDSEGNIYEYNNDAEYLKAVHDDIFKFKYRQDLGRNEDFNEHRGRINGKLNTLRNKKNIFLGKQAIIDDHYLI